jgi:hypothetical protein
MDWAWLVCFSLLVWLGSSLLLVQAASVPGPLANSSDTAVLAKASDAVHSTVAADFADAQADAALDDQALARQPAFDVTSQAFWPALTQRHHAQAVVLPMLRPPRRLG